MSVSDASAVWYLSILGATAQATLPLAPHLRETLLAVTRYFIYIYIIMRVVVIFMMMMVHWW